MAKGHSPVEDRLRAEHGENLTAYLRELYVDRRLSYRKMMPILGVRSNQALRALLERHGIPIRRGGEAVRTQWEGAAERRRAASEQLRRDNLERAARGEHWAKGYTKDTHPGLAEYSRKLAERQWLKRPSAVRKATRSRRRAFRQDPSRHANSHVGMTNVEQRFADFLTSIGRDFVFNDALILDGELYFPDFRLTNSRVLIEVTKVWQRVPADRLRAFAAGGYTPLVLPNGTVLSDSLDEVEDVIARAERGELNPATVRECWVIRRGPKGSAARQAYLAERLR